MATADSRVGLGTRLRHLIDLLDGDVRAQYASAGLTGYRPRYTPVIRALDELGPATLTAIAHHAGSSHSAICQTVAQMRRVGLVETRPGGDGRERVATMTTAAHAQLPALQAHWAATTAAADALDAELDHGLRRTVDAAIEALERRPFRDRVDAQAGREVS